MNVLITGGCGYIGQHLKKLLSTEQYNVDILDIADRSKSIDIRLLPTINKNYHTVIHLAALVKINESVRLPEEYYKTNILGTLNVLNQLNFQNFIFASTGSAKDMNSPYAISKRAGEDITKSICTRYDKQFTIFRFYNVLGSEPFAPTNPDGLFFNLIKAETLGYFNLYGTDYNTKDGTCIRDYVHVNDICRAMISAIHKPANKIENLGHGVGRSVKEIIDIYKAVNSVDFQINPMPRRSGDLETSVLDQPSDYLKSTYTIEQLLINRKIKL